MVAEFTEELEKLCQKHRLYIDARGDHLAIFDMDDEPQPFTLARVPSPAVQQTFCYGLEYLDVAP